MKRAKLSGLVLLLSIVGAGAPRAEVKPPASNVAYFHGTVKYSSPDGTRPYGASSSLVKRTVQPAAGRIEELVAQPGKKPGDPAAEYVTVLSRVGATSTFSAKDAGSTFSGTLSYKGSDWAWASWTYDLTMAAGGKLVGEGALSKEGISTRKTLLGKDGQPTVLVVEELRPITEEKYVELRQALFPR